MLNVYKNLHHFYSLISRRK